MERAGLPWPSDAERVLHAAATGSLLSEHDIYLFRQGALQHMHRHLGAHLVPHDAESRAIFSVWAPNAEAVSVIGDFNGWNAEAGRLKARPDGSGIWEGMLAGVHHGDRYKYRIRSRVGGYESDKADPLAFCMEEPPHTASRVWDLGYEWQDGDWMRERGRRNALDAPVSIYEVHLGSWRGGRDGRRFLNYRELAHELADYVTEMGFTHVEVLPITEHPFYGSWGYQTTSYFAPTARYGTPQDFMYFVDVLHQRGIGVILDWVPSHFPNDAHGLYEFDGTHLYEHADPRQGYHPEWNTPIFNYGRNEVKGFLVSSALFWLETYHVDMLRVDAVASMLYLDYARKPGEWVPNRHGGRENLEAVNFIRELNAAVYRDHPDVQTIAEESTAWPNVSRPTWLGGLGFGLKWNMGWMHDTLKYFSRQGIHRRYHHGELTFSLWYAFNENFVLPLSHDEVVYGKRSLIEKQPGDDWQKFAGLRSMFGFMWVHPGKKLLFMGGEFGQRREWQHEEVLEWFVLQYPLHAGLQRWVADLNRYYRGAPALYEVDFSSEGFQWIDCDDHENSVVVMLRLPRASGPCVIAACNFTTVPRVSHRIGVPRAGWWREVLNSDAPMYGGSGMGNFGGVSAQDHGAHGRPYSVELTLPPLSVVLLESAQ
ncbi:MAG: 1,4-alpha-glucan branching protein GlgB [Rhodocyclaceae bacterium]